MQNEYHFMEGSYHDLCFNKSFYKKQIMVDNDHMLRWRKLCEDTKTPCVYCCGINVDVNEDLCKTCIENLRKYFDECENLEGKKC